MRTDPDLATPRYYTKIVGWMVTTNMYIPVVQALLQGLTHLKMVKAGKRINK